MDDTHRRFLRWRDIDPRDMCTTCRGSGRLMYSNTSTWHKGIGGSAMTHDVCDACWGSGDTFHPGADLRKLRDEETKRVAERAADLLARSVGSSMANCHGAILHIVIALDKLVDKRGAPAAPYLPELALGLANTLRRAIGMPERKERP